MTTALAELRGRVSDARLATIEIRRLLTRVESLKAELGRARRARAKADANSARFHALLIAERVRKIGSGTAPTRPSLAPPLISEGRPDPYTQSNGCPPHSLEGKRAAGSRGGDSR